VKRIERFAQHWYICWILDDDPLEAFPRAMSLYNDASVDHSYPELLRWQAPSSTIRPQWHLYETEFSGTRVNAHIHAEEAWEAGFKGRGTTVGLIDDGFDTEHVEFQPGSAVKVIAPVTIEGGVFWKGCRPAGGHGTRCGGVACAAGHHRASGVAPEAAILPIGCGTSSLSFNSLDVSLAFKHAADCGADVISCSWNPSSLPFELPPLTRDAMNYAADYGRGGKGCVIVFSAGNSSRSMDDDGYAAHPKAIAVAATNGDNERAAFSNFGAHVWCSAPGGHARSTHARAPRWHAIFTTDPMGDEGEVGDYTSFYGTSASAAVVAGVAALVIGANRSLTREDVKSLLAETCEKIGDAGSYGDGGHSRFYGFGRVNAFDAVSAASA
jgi:subtilisin family serine protease